MPETDSDDNIHHVTLPVLDDDGKVVTRELVEVQVLATGVFRLLHSPAYAEGLAAHDEFELVQDAPGGFRLRKRAGNLAVVVSFPSAELSAGPDVDTLNNRVKDLGGWCEGGPEGVLVFTVPVAAGFDVVEALFDRFAHQRSHTDWWFGNVYDPESGEPLDWWHEAPAAET